MIHAKKVVAELEATGQVQNRTFYLSSGWNPLTLAREFRALLALAHDFQPQVVHGHYGGKTGLATVLLARLVSARAVVQFRGSDLNPAPSDDPWRSAMMNFLSQIACIGADYRIFVSQALSRRVWFLRTIGDAWTVMPSGYDARIFRPGDRDQARRQLGLPMDLPVLAFVPGRTPLVKGEPLVREVVLRLQESLTFHFESVVDWPPDRLALLMQAADCLIFASPFEGSPCVVQEALACGLPLVSVDVGDVRDLAEGTTGVDIVAREVEALTQAVARRLLQPVRVATPPPVLAADFCRTAANLLSLYRAMAGGRT